METVLLFVAHGINEGFLRACDESLETVLAICRFITPTFMSIALIVSIGRGYLSGHGLQIDLSPVIKALGLYLVLFFYRDLTDILGAGIKGVTHLFDGSGNVGEALQRLTAPPGIAAAAQSDTVAPAEVVEQGGAWYSKIYHSIANFSLMNLITEFFTSTTVMLIRLIVLYIRQFALGFLYVVGPLAICLSVIPAFAGLMGKWLQNFIAVQFWALTMNLLDLIYINFADQNTTAGGVLGGLVTIGQTYNDVQFLVMSVAFIILYCMVPTLTSYFIGSTAVQTILGSFIGIATGAAGTAGAVMYPPSYGGGASGALGRALGFGNAERSTSGESLKNSSVANSEDQNSPMPTMSSGGAESTTVRYNSGGETSFNRAMQASPTDISDYSAEPNDSEDSYYHDSASTLDSGYAPSMGAEGYTNYIRQEDSFSGYPDEDQEGEEPYRDQYDED